MAWAAMPLAPFALAFAAGIALAPWVATHAAWAAWLAGAAAALALLRDAGAIGERTAAAVVLLVMTAATGTLRAAVSPLPLDHVARLALPRVARVEGRLDAEPTRWSPERGRLRLAVERVDGLPRRGLLPVTVYGPLPEVAEGQRVAVRTRLYRPTGFRNPGTFDAAAALAREDVFVLGTARADAIEPLEPPRPPWNARVRRAALGAIDRALPPVSAALLRGLLLGDRAGMPPDVDAAFRRAGVSHVLAVSGFNVALLAGAVWAALSAAGTPRRATALACMVVVTGFAMVVGFEPSVARATIMALLVLAALLLEREASVRNGLAVAALAVLAIRPSDLYDPGFQLSFAATAGIVAMPMPRGAIASALAVSVAAQLAVLPIALAHFNQVSVIGVVANLAVVPLAGLATLAGFAAAALAAVSEAVATPLFDAIWPVLLALRMAVAIAAAVPGAVVHAPAPSIAAVGSYAAALVAARVAWTASDRRRGVVPALWCGVAGLLALALAAAAAPVLRGPDGVLRVAVLDVGQGDAIVVRAPDGRTLLVDAGPGGPGRLDAGERVVAPFLWNSGVLGLDTAAVTHDDADHAGGMRAVRRLFAPRRLWRGVDAPAGPVWLGGAMVTALATPALSRNDAGLVLRIEYGAVSFLLAADIEAAGERGLVEGGVPLAATVLKVSHHGSRTSTSRGFLEAVRPALAVVSVGARNPYGHPDPGVLARLAAAHARVYRTDRDGAVLFETDGRRMVVTRWAARAVERWCVDPNALC